MFGRNSKDHVATRAPEDGLQEVTVRVNDGYSPDEIVVERGRPVRLTFIRDESSPCSDTVVFDDFGISAKLPKGESVAVEISPKDAGSYAFGCAMGMVRGTLVVR